MGADLYIERITEAARRRFEQPFNEAAANRDRLMKLAQTEAQHGSKDRAEAFRKEADECQKRVSKLYDQMYPNRGYFRDSYNGTSVLWRLNLSWWQDAPNGQIETPDELNALKAFRDKVAGTKLKPLTLAELKENRCTVDKGENSFLAWRRYFRNKKRRLVNFLNRAIAEREAGNPVRFSC